MRVNTPAMTAITRVAAPAMMSGDRPPLSFDATGAAAFSVGTATAIEGAADVGVGLAVGEGLAVGVGSTVRATVGATVGAMVGATVGATVGAGVATARTMTVPIIAAPWMPQT